MGSSGSKKRKPSHSQPLPKVGTTTENRRLQHDEREAVVENFGLRGGAGTAAWIGIVALLALVVGAILVLVLI